MKYSIYIFLFLIPLKGISQIYADKSYYLVDSLNLNELSKKDKNILDSALTIYHNTSNDTDQLNALAIIPKEMLHDDWSKYSYLLIDLSKSKLDANPINFFRNVYLRIHANALNDVGVMHYYNGNLISSLEYYNEALEIRKRIQDNGGIASSLCNIGLIYKNQGRVSKALEYYFKSLKIIESIDGLNGKADVLHNIGSIYEVEEDIPKAIRYYLKSIEIEKKLENRLGLAGSYVNLGFVYQRAKEDEKAREIFLESLKIYQDLEYKRGIADSYIGLGMVDYGEKNYTKSIENYKKSLVIKEGLKHKRGIASVVIKLGYAYFQMGNIELAEKFANRGLEIAYEINSPQNIQTAAKLLSKIYKHKKIYKEGWEMFELHITMWDSIFNLKTEKAIIKQESKYQLEKREHKIELQKKNIEVLEKDKKIKNYTLYGLIGFIFLLIIAVYLWFRNYKFKKNIEESEIRHQLDLYIKEVKLLKNNKEQTNVMDTIKGDLNTSLKNPLSERELEVLEELSKGKTNKDIAVTLFVSVNTIRTHLNKIYEKLDVSNRTQAVKKANDIGNRPNG